jgi:hypothetical protein
VRGGTGIRGDLGEGESGLRLGEVIKLEVKLSLRDKSSNLGMLMVERRVVEVSKLIL